MPLNTAEDIVEAVSEKERDSEITALRDRFEDDFDLWRLSRYQLGANPREYENYTSNEPQNLVNNIVRRLTKAPLLIGVAIENDTEELRKQKADIERFYYGCLNLANSRLKAGISPSIQGLLAFYSALRGWLVTRVFIRKDEDGKTIPDIKVWDALHVTWQVGDDGLAWVCNTRKISKSQAKAKYDINITGNTVKVYDFLDGEFNKVVIDGKFKINYNHKLGYTPALINTVGATPFIQSENFTDTLKYSGESVLAPNRDIYPFKNKVMTEYATIVSQGAHNPLAITSSGGKKTFTKSPYYKGAVVQLDVDKGESVEALYKPEMPRNTAELLGNVMRDLSMGGMPPIAGGELNFQLPFSAVNLLIDAASAVMLFPQVAIEESFEWICRELQTQYAKGGFEKLKLHGRDGTEEFFQIELSSKDVKGDWFPDCRLLPTLPEDKPASYAMAQTAVRNRLLSRKTAMAKHLGVRDPDTEDKKILIEMANEIPSIQIRKIAIALIDEGRFDLAQVLIAEFQAGLQAPGQGGARGGEEAVQPQFATGMPGEAGVTPEQFGRIQRPPGEREQFAGDELRNIGP